MGLLAIPLGYPKTVAKWLVISETRREQKNAATHILGYVSKKIFLQHRSWNEMWIFRDAPLGYVVAKTAVVLT